MCHLPEDRSLLSSSTNEIQSKSISSIRIGRVSSSAAAACNTAQRQVWHTNATHFVTYNTHRELYTQTHGFTHSRSAAFSIFVIDSRSNSQKLQYIPIITGIHYNVNNNRFAGMHNNARSQTNAEESTVCGASPRRLAICQ